MKMGGVLLALLILAASLAEKAMAAETAEPLQVAMLDEAPFSYIRGGERQGCDPAFYRALLAPLGRSYHFSGFPINRLMDVFARADTDLIVTSAPTLSAPSNSAFEYIGPIYELYDVIITRDRPLTSRIEDFAGLRMGQPTGVCWRLCQDLAKLAIAERPFRSVEQGVRLLMANRVDAIVAPEHIYRMALAGMSPQVTAPVISYHGPSQYLFLAINRHVPETLRQQIKTAWGSMGADGYRHLCDQQIKKAFLH